MNSHYSAENTQPTPLFPPRTKQQYTELSWTNFQIAFSILLIGMIGGLMIGSFYSLFLGLYKGLILGLFHGLVAGSLWLMIWYCKWADK